MGWVGFSSVVQFLRPRSDVRFGVLVVVLAVVPVHTVILNRHNTSDHSFKEGGYKIFLLFAKMSKTLDIVETRCF